ncbi:hypothetical protein PTI98_010129 [Pleurotus ostreatus]|nr:hypothetical protein PTI98_010129 [Pleurotus ostreatus]
MAKPLISFLHQRFESEWGQQQRLQAPECVSGGTLASSPANFGRKKKQVGLYFSIGTNGQNSLHYRNVSEALPQLPCGSTAFSEQGKEEAETS